LKPLEALVRAAGVGAPLHGSASSAADWLDADRRARYDALMELDDLDPSKGSVFASLKAGDY